MCENVAEPQVNNPVIINNKRRLYVLPEPILDVLCTITIKRLFTFTATYAIMKSVLQSPDGQTRMRTLFEKKNIAKRSLSWNAVPCVTNVEVLIAKHPTRLLSKTVISHIYWRSKWMIYDLLLRSVFLRTLHKTLFPISYSHTLLPRQDSTGDNVRLRSLPIYASITINRERIVKWSNKTGKPPQTALRVDGDS
jgi:hypothetical protein